MDCGYGVMLAQTLVEKGAKVVAGKLEISKRIYHSFLNLIKFISYYQRIRNFQNITALNFVRIFEKF